MSPEELQEQLEAWAERVAAEAPPISSEIRDQLAAALSAPSGPAAHAA